MRWPGVAVGPRRPVTADTRGCALTIARMVSFASAFCSALLLALSAAPAVAQPADAPPRLAPGPAAAPVRDAGRDPARETARANAVGPIVEDEAVDDLPAARITSPEARIEQRRQGNRVVDITVTPAGSTRSYTIVNREGQRPANVQELSSGLSTPRFFKLEF